MIVSTRHGHHWMGLVPAAFELAADTAWSGSAEDPRGLRKPRCYPHRSNRDGDATRRQGEFLAQLDPLPDVVLLQEVNRRSVDTLCEVAGMDWLHCAVDLRRPQPGDTPVRRRGVTITGRTPPPAAVRLLDNLPLPERLLIAALSVDGQVMHMASYHAPPGVSWFEKKPQQAVGFARWLATVTGPAAFGADDNTPLVDASMRAVTMPP